MPGTAVASRKNSWKRIAHKYKVHTEAYYAKREAFKLAKARKMAMNRAMSKH